MYYQVTLNSRGETMIDKEDFIKQINRKQPEAFHYLFKSYYKSLVYFAMRYVDEREVGEDLVQELFAQLWESKSEYLSYNSFRTFLYNSVRNASINYLRHKDVEQKYVSYSLLNAGQDDELDLKVMEEELYRTLFRFVEELPARRKEIFMLYLQGKKNEEIAILLGVSPETVKTAKKEAVRYIRERMGNLFFFLVMLEGCEILSKI